MLHYLRHIRTIWGTIINGVPNLSIDAITVQNLELLTPAISSQDLSTVVELMQSRTVFPTINDETIRSTLLRNISSVSCLIPSLRTFFENLKYLEPCCTALRALVGPKQKETIRTALFASYSHPSRLSVEVNEHHGVSQLARLPPRTFDEDRRLGYLQLWIYAMRKFPQMTRFAPRKERTKAKPNNKPPSAACIRQFACLAVNLGFRTRYALALQGQDPEEALASQFLQQAELDSLKGNHLYVRPIANLLKRGRTETQLRIGPPMIHLVWEGLGESLERRCGVPFEDSFNADKRSLFLPFFRTATVLNGSGITSFYVKRDFIHSFFRINFHEV
jgi:hypothetical protein